MPQQASKLLTSTELRADGMDLGELFRLPERSGVAGFAEAQTRLYRVNESLQDYFLPLQLNFARVGSGAAPPLRFSRRFFGLAMRKGYRLLELSGRRKYKADVLYCPMTDFRRSTENKLFLRTLRGLLQTGASILCLLPQGAPCQKQVAEMIEAEKKTSQVVLLDPLALLNPRATRFFFRAARERGRAAFSEVSEILEPFELNPPCEAEGAFEEVARYVEAWNSIEESVEFDAVVARCHWQMLCSPICRTARERGKTVITFQQGVIDHTLDVPLSAAQYVAYGPASASFLARMNRSFFKAVRKDEPQVDFIPGGSLQDALLDLPDQFAHRTLLVIHEPDPNAFYGLDIHRRGVFKVVSELLRSGTALRRIIVRLHPYAPNGESDLWKELVREHRDCCEISYLIWSLEDDLARASVVIGNYSGTLTVAAASGLPTFFVETECFATNDLICFRNGQTVSPDEAVWQITRLSSDETAYAQARTVALRNAAEYYAGGANATLECAFLEHKLRIRQRLV